MSDKTRRSHANGSSFSNGAAPGAEEDQWSGIQLRPVHWWLYT